MPTSAAQTSNTGTAAAVPADLPQEATQAPDSSPPAASEEAAELGRRPSSSTSSLPRLNSRRAPSDSGSEVRAAAAGRTESLGPDPETVVLTPSRLRLDSRVVVAHTTCQWFTNALWALLILFKLNGVLGGSSWWAIFVPSLVNHMGHIPLQIVVLVSVHRMIYRQIGPPPPATARSGLHLQYAVLCQARTRTHIIDTINNLIESVTTLIVKVLFCQALASGTLNSTSLRLMFTPCWVSWGATTILGCLKDRSERMFGSTRDLLYIFLLFVAFKVDDQSSYSWRVVFLVPWIWFSALMLLAAMLVILLLVGRVWARLPELLLPLGFACLLLATVPQFVSYIALVRRLDGDKATSVESILIPNAVSWLLMWVSALVLAGALRAKERLRDALLARGAVWTLHESLARHLDTERQEAMRRIDQLTEEEVAKMVDAMMAHKHKPGRLQRVGATLYKRMASLELPMRRPASLTLQGHNGGGGGGSSRRSMATAAAAAAVAAADAAVGHHSSGQGGAGTALPQASAAQQQQLRQVSSPSPDLSTLEAGEGLTAASVRSMDVPSMPPLQAGSSTWRSGGSLLVQGRLRAQSAVHPEPLNMLLAGAAGPHARGREGGAAEPPDTVGMRPASAAVPGTVTEEGDAGSGGGGRAHTARRTSDASARAPAVLSQGGGAPHPTLHEAPHAPAHPHAPEHLPDAAAPRASGNSDTGEHELAATAPAAAPSAAGPCPSPGLGEDDGLCVICYDNEATCVFLECGHGGFCRRCAYLLFVRPPNECPTCRAVIEQVVEVEPTAPVGHVAKVVK